MGKEERFVDEAGDKPVAGGDVDELFEVPYEIASSEAAADLSDIGNGRGYLIDQRVDEIIDSIDAKPVSEDDAFSHS